MPLRKKRVGVRSSKKPTQTMQQLTSGVKFTPGREKKRKREKNFSKKKTSWQKVHRELTVPPAPEFTKRKTQ